MAGFRFFNLKHSAKMKTRIYLILSAIAILSSCAPNKFYSRNWLGDIPAITPQAPIQIFYPNDPLPTKAYVEVLRMDVALKGYRNSKRLVEELQTTALHEGVDAIIVLDANSDTLAISQQRMRHEFDFYDNDPSISEGYIDGVFYEMISGIGIKYVENLDYINRYIKNEELYLVNDTLSTPFLLANISYYPSGSVKSLDPAHPRAEDLYVEYIKLYAPYYLLYDQNGQWHEWFYENRLIKREKYRLDDWMVRRVRVNYDDYGKEYRIYIRNNENRYPFTETIDLERKNGRLVKRTINRYEQPDLIEKFTYDSNNIIIARDIYQLIDGKEQHLFKSIFSHYRKEDLKDLLQNKGLVSNGDLQP